MGNESAKQQSSFHASTVDAQKNHFSELPGTVHAQYRRYGSKVCGPYWFRFWRENGKLRKQYVKASEVETVRKLCNARQERRRARLDGLATLRRQRAKGREILRELRLMQDVFGLMEILDRKEEDQLTDLQWKRVHRVFEQAGIEI